MSVATMSPAVTTKSAARPLGVQPYLSFEGRCAEAIAFYTTALGAEVTMMMRFGDAPKDGGCGGEGMTPPPADMVMHASLKIGATEIFATDGMCQASGAQFKGIALSLAMPTVAAAEQAFAALADGGTVQMPLAETFFGERFGMVADRFGVAWMVIVPKPM